MLDMPFTLQDDVQIVIYSTFDRIHKCKRCLKYVCASCGSQKEFVIDEDGARTIEKHRVCIKCRDDIRLINETLRKVHIR